MFPKKDYEDPRFPPSNQPINRTTSHTTYYSSSQQQQPPAQDILGGASLQSSYTYNKSTSGPFGSGTGIESVKRTLPSDILIQSPNAGSSYSLQKSSSGQILPSPSGNTTTVFVNRPSQQQSAEIDYRKSVAEGFRSEKVRDDIMRRSLVQVMETEKNTFSMAKDTNLTVFVMAIEIERLNGEVDAWKLRYTDLDRRISDRASVEEALRVESLKVLELKAQINSLLQENGGMKTQIKTLLDERSRFDFSAQGKFEESERRFKDLVKDLEAWKMRYSTLERTKDKEMEDLRMTFEARRKSYIEREVKDITLRFNNEKASWENDMRRLRDLLEARTKENEEFKSRYSKMEITINEMKGGQSKLLDYENRLALMSSEIERLNEILFKKSGEIEEWQNRYSKLEITISQSSSKDSKIRELEGFIANLQREIERLGGVLRDRDGEFEREKVKRSRLESDLNTVKVLEMKIKEYENKLALLTTEVERLNGLLIKEREEKTGMRARLADFESRSSGLDVQVRQWEGRYKDSMREIEEWKKKYGELQITITESRSYEVKVRELENKLALTSSEVQRLNDMLKRGKGENEALRIRITELEGLDSKIRDYENRIAMLSSEIERLNVALRVRGDELDSWKTKYSKLEISIGEYRGLEGRLRDYESSIAGMQREIERLNAALRDKHDEVDREKVKRSKMEGDVGKIRELENKIALITSEIERLNGLLMKERQEKDGAIGNCRRLEMKVTEYENKIAMLSSEVQRLNDLVGKLRNELEIYGGRITEYENNLSEAGKYKILVQEMETRYNRLGKELDDWKRKNGELIIQINEYRSYESRLRDYENKIAMITSENERINSLMKKEREEINILRSKVTEYEIILKDIPGLQGQVKQWEARYNLILKELDDWKKKHGELLGQVQEIPHLHMVIQQWETRFADTMNELEHWKKEHGDLSGKMNELRVLEVRIREYEEKLVMFTSEIERLNTKLKGKVEEVEGWKKKYSQLEIQLAEARSLELKIRDYERMMNEMHMEIDRLNAILNEKHNDLEREKVKRSKLEGDVNTIKALQMKLEEYENRIAMLSSEIERLNNLLNRERGEKEELKKKIGGLEHENLELKGYAHQLETQITNIQKEFEAFKARYMQLESSYNETRGWEARLREYENKIAMLTSEIQRLSSLNSQRSEEVEVWKSKFIKIESTMRQLSDYEVRLKILGEEIDRLNEQHDRDNEEITTYKNKWVEYSNLNNKFNEHMFLFVIIMAENEALRMRVIEKENEVEEVRRQSLTPYRKSVSEIVAETRKSGVTTTVIKSEIFTSGNVESLKKSGGQLGGSEMRSSGGQFQDRTSQVYQYTSSSSSGQQPGGFQQQGGYQQQQGLLQPGMDRQQYQYSSNQRKF